MNRYGNKSTGLANSEDIIKKGPGLKFIGFTTNLAGSNGEATSLSDNQEESFKRIMNDAREHLDGEIHLSYESSGIAAREKNAEGTLVRIGHLLYGLTPTVDNGLDLRPVMSVKSKIAELQNVEKGEGIGYGFSFIAEEDMRIAVIPLGYADGYPWALSNKGHVLIRDRMVPVAGRVCMDAFMVDVTGVEGCEAGDEVIIMGAKNGHAISAHMLGEWACSFSYEIMSGWSRRLPRIYK